MDSDLATALAAERAIVRRAVSDAREIDGGWVVRHPPLPEAWHLNRVHLVGEAPGLRADTLEALAARELAGVRHRRVTLDDEAAADRLWRELEPRGWRRERAVVMVWRGSAPVAADGPLVRELDGAMLESFQMLAFADDAGATGSGSDLGSGSGSGSGSEGLPALIAASQAALRAGTGWRGFGAGGAPGGLPASAATLYLDPDVGGCRVAFVDQVATLRAERERGLARAVTVAAVAAAAEWDAGLVALFADADDWPQVFYASLGFGTVGRQTVFHRDG